MSKKSLFSHHKWTVKCRRNVEYTSSCFQMCETWTPGTLLYRMLYYFFYIVSYIKVLLDDMFKFKSQ